MTWQSLPWQQPSALVTGDSDGQTGPSCTLFIDRATMPLDDLNLHDEDYPDGYVGMAHPSDYQEVE